MNTEEMREFVKRVADDIEWASRERGDEEPHTFDARARSLALTVLQLFVMEEK